MVTQIDDQGKIHKFGNSKSESKVYVEIPPQSFMFF